MACHLSPLKLVNAGMLSTSPPARASEAGAIAYNLAGIAALVLLLAVGAAYLLDQAGRNTRPPAPALDDGNPLAQTIGGRELTIPTSWFRHGEQLRSGFVDQIDLETRLPLVAGAPPLSVDVTLLPRGRARSSATLLDTVYLHQFSDETLPGPAGLVGKPLLAANENARETVWYDPLAPSPFVAKCQASVTPDAPARCLRTVSLSSGLVAVFSFEATALEGWRTFDTEMARWLGRIGAI